MSLETNFNISPYFDDYDETKNYHRILFRPAVPVQARELTQLQTILQKQVERFGDNIYKQGTIIKGCTFTYDYNYEYIKIKDLQVSGLAANPSSYANLYAVETTSNLYSIVVNSTQGLESQDPDTNILYIKYINTGSGQKKKFANNETITVFNQDFRLVSVSINSGGTLYSNTDYITFSGGGGSGASANIVTFSNGTIRSIVFSSTGTGYVTTPSANIVNSSGGSTITGSGASLSVINYVAQVTVANSSFSANSTSPVGVGTAVTVSDGIIYQKGHFLRVEQQTVIVDKFSKSPNNVVLGFYTQESVVNNSVDTTLLDNAQGYSNYTAPGANRLKLTPILQVLPTANAAANTEFFKLVEFENGRVVKRRTDTEFNSIDKKLSQRTAEESGDYVVNQFQISTSDILSNTTHLNVVVGPGVGYVDGTRIELNDSVTLKARQGIDTNTATSQSIATNYGNYVLIKEMLGTFNFTSGGSVNLKNAVNSDVTDNFGGAPNSAGSTIGTAKIRSLEYESGTVGTSDAVYRLYLFDIRMSKGYTFKDIRSVQSSGAVADVVLQEGNAILTDTDFDTLVFTSGFTSVNSISNVDLIYRTLTTNTFNTSGNTTIEVSGAYDTFPYTAGGTLNSVQERDFIVIPSVNAISSSNLTGTVSSSGNVITGTSTDFINQLDVGDYIKFQGNTSIFRVSTIASAASMTVAGTSGPVVSSNTFVLAFPANVPIRLDRTGANVQIGALGTTATINIGNNITSTAAVKIIHNVKVSPGSNIIHKAKSVTKRVFVKLSTDKLTTSTKGPWCLGLPDAFKLNAVYVGTSNTYSNTTTNYASSFQLDSGQTDNLYGLSYLSYKPGSTLSLSATNCLLVEVDLFTHGAGYFISSRSYPVDDTTTTLPSDKIRTESIPTFTSPKTGKVESLRNVVDFRPMVANTANASATTVASASIDPSSTETITGTLYFPTPNEVFEADVQYYMSRADRVILDRNGNVTLKEGISSTTPVPPAVPNKAMLLGTVLIPPYPSLSPKKAAEVKRQDYATYVKMDQVKRYTMKDIKQIEERIQRLEYYSLLNTLEKDAKDLVIPSESNTSINRFKNGFFVDPLNSYDIANVDDPEFNILIDDRQSYARPPIDQNTINLKIKTANSVNATVKGDIALLSYTDEVAFNQPLATRFRNLAQLAWGYEGTLRVFPEYDNYYDSTRKAVKFTFDLATPLNSLIKTINDTVVFKADSKKVTVKQSDWTDVGPAWWDGALNQQQVANQTTTTTTTTGSISAGSTTQNDQEIGDFISDFDFNPFIREQEVYFVVTGLRPGSRHYAFFDKQSVESRPGQIASLANITSTASLEEDNNFKFTGVKNANLVANSTGGLAGVLYIPGGTFNVGQREILITDVDDVDSLDTSISKATCFFNAYNFTKQISNLTMVTKQPSAYSLVVTPGEIIETVPISRVRRWDPLAQTFSINFNDGTDGCFVTKFDIFFKQKSSTLGLTIQVRETDNGYPSPVILSQKQISASQVNVSDDGTSATTIVLDTPVFIRNNKDYCIAVLPDQNTPDYFIWTAVPGQPDVATNSVDNGDFGIGVLFLSSNDKVWTPIQNEDVKIKAYYAKFTSTSGSILLENDNYEFLSVSNTEGSFVGGERVAQKNTSYITSAVFTGNTTSAVVNTTASLTSSVSADDYLLIVYGDSATSAKTGTVSVSSGNTTVTGSGTSFNTEYGVGDYLLINSNVREVTAIANSTQLTIDAPLSAVAASVAHYGVTDTVQVNKVVSVNTSSVTLRDFLTKTIDNSTVYSGVQKVVTGVIDKINNDDTIVLKSSTAANSSFVFAANRSVVGGTSQARCTIDALDDYTVNYVEPHISTVVPNPTGVSITQAIVGTSATTANQSISFGISNKTLYEAEIRSRSNEIVTYSGAKSLNMFVSLTRPANSNKISPIIDLNPASAVVLQNRINNSSANETTSYGSALVRYISKQVVLADGLDAEDFKLYLTAYKPVGTNVLVYGKFLSGSDPESFSDKEWTLLDQTTESNLYSDSANLDDYIDYEFSVPRTQPAAAISGKVTTNSNTTLTGVDTAFTSALAAGDIVKIVSPGSPTAFEINVVESVSNNTVLVLSNSNGPYSNTSTSGFNLEKVSQPKAAFKYSHDNNIVRYYDSNESGYSTYKIFSVKIVLLSSSTEIVPTLRDIRALAVSV